MMKRLLVFVLLAVLAMGATVQAQDSLTYNTPVTGEMTETDYEFTYKFDGTEGDVVVIDLEPVDPLGDLENPILMLQGPDGDMVGDTTDFFTFGSVSLALELPSTGAYTLTVTRADGDAGESVGEFTLEVIQAEALAVGGAVSGSTDSDSRTQYYYVNAAQEFGVSYEKLTGDFYAQLAVNLIDETGSLREVAVASGDEAERLALGSFDADTLYLVTISRPLFSFAFNTVTAEYELQVTEAQ